MNSKNYEICRYLKISYTEAVVKNQLHLAHFVMYDVYKLKHL
jgi:hypothetical protein